MEASLAELAGDDLDRLLGRQHVFTWAGDLIGPIVLAGSVLVSRTGLPPAAVRRGGLATALGALGTAMLPGFPLHLASLAIMGFGTAVVWAGVHHRSLTVGARTPLLGTNR